MDTNYADAEARVRILAYYSMDNHIHPVATLEELAAHTVEARSIQDCALASWNQAQKATGPGFEFQLRT
jgi:hypothetical protein